MKLRYKVWSDSESKIQIEEIEFVTLKEASDCASVSCNIPC